MAIDLATFLRPVLARIIIFTTFDNNMDFRTRDKDGLPSDFVDAAPTQQPRVTRTSRSSRPSRELTKPRMRMLSRDDTLHDEESEALLVEVVEEEDKANGNRRGHECCGPSRSIIVVLLVVAVLSVGCVGAYAGWRSANRISGGGGGGSARYSDDSVNVDFGDSTATDVGTMSDTDGVDTSRRGGSATTPPRRLQQRLRECVSTIPGWFTGQELYEAAARDLSGRGMQQLQDWLPAASNNAGATTATATTPIFVELGA